jgi:putative ABC transport system permease protein
VSLRLRAAAAIGLDALRINPLRTVLSTLGVIIGVAALVSVLSVGDGMERALRAQIAETTDLHAISVTARSLEEVDGQYFPIGDPVVFTPAQARELRSLPGVSGVVLSVDGTVEVRAADGPTRRMAFLIGGIAYQEPVSGMAVVAGRLPTREEQEGPSAVVSVSHDLARALAPDSSAPALVGRSILVGGEPAQVAGVLAPRPAPESGVNPRRRVSDYRVVAPFAFALRAMSAAPQRRLPSLTVTAALVEETPAVRARLERWLSAADTAWRRRVTVTTSERRLEQASQGIVMFKLFMGAITGISLLVGGIGIMNVLLSSVTERTREIGIRKAAGARRRDIRRQFLAESIAISGMGSAIGLVLGVAGAFGITAMIRHFSRAAFLHASLSWSTLGVAAGAALFVGLTFGTYPARRAARLSPIDAIRHE